MHQATLKPGQRLSFTTDSPLYPDVYQVEILAAHPDRIDLHLCFHRGYLLLLPVGTNIRWLSYTLNGANLISQVITRKTNDKVWSVTVPQQTRSSVRHTRVLAIGSGKGGVGKTAFTINLGLALSRCHQRVILLDADIGMANIEVLLGLENSRDLTDVLQGKCTLPEILTEGPGGIRVLPGSSGMASLLNLDSLKFNRIISGFTQLESNCDILIIDTGAGLSEMVLKFLEAADEFLLLTTPEPHAIMDAYALTKVLFQRNPRLDVNLIMNRCESRTEAIKASETFTRATKQFLGIQPRRLGWLPDEPLVTRSLKNKEPIFITHPQIDFSRQTLKIAQHLSGLEISCKKPPGLKTFINHLKTSATALVRG